MAKSKASTSSRKPVTRPSRPSAAAKPAAKTAASKPVAKPAASATTARRLWLSYPPEQIKEPVVWQMSQRFPIVFDIRQASVTDKIGILCLELEGAAKDVEAAILWLRKVGVRVEPVELSALES